MLCPQCKSSNIALAHDALTRGSTSVTGHQSLLLRPMFSTQTQINPVVQPIVGPTQPEPTWRFYLIGAVIAGVGLVLGSALHWEVPILWGGFLGIGGLVLAWPKIAFKSREQASVAYEEHQSFLRSNWFCFSCGHVSEKPLEPGQHDSSPDGPITYSGGLKKCPFCAEEIKVEAVVCKHCQRQLPAAHLRAGGLLPSKQTNPLAGLAGLLVFGALFLGLMGISEFYGGSTTRNLYQGTILEGNADARRITSNAMASGWEKIGFAAILFLFAVGAQFAGQVMVKKKNTPEP